VYVYRDTGGHGDNPGPAAAQPAEQDASYWYDLPGTGSGGDASQMIKETRGPFEPLVSSADPPGTARRLSAGLDTAGAAAPDPAAPDPARPADAPGAPAGEKQDTVHAQARKLEQIKDLYLTAEAIGEANVDKHFDQLLTQQRELISEYFKQSSAAGPAAGRTGQAETEPAGPGDSSGSGDAGGPAGASQSARVAAEQPRAW
jgi:hypothetical protein